MFRVGPEVGIEPVQPIGRTSAHGVAQDCFIRIRLQSLSKASVVTHPRQAYA